MSSCCSTLISSASRRSRRAGSARVNVFSLDSSTSARCTSSSRRFSPSRWRCTSSSTSAVGTGISTVSSSCSTTLSRACDALLERFDLLEPARARSARSSSRVSNSAGDLGEVVVGLGQLALLDRLDGDDDSAVLALVVAAGERRGERLVSPAVMPIERLVDALDHVARADLVGDAVDRCRSPRRSIVATRSMETKSPVLAGRSTPCRACRSAAAAR